MYRAQSCACSIMAERRRGCDAGRTHTWKHAGGHGNHEQQPGNQHKGARFRHKRGWEIRDDSAKHNARQGACGDAGHRQRDPAAHNQANKAHRIGTERKPNRKFARGL